MTDDNIVITINEEDDTYRECGEINLDYVNDFLSEVEVEEEDLRTPYILDYAENYTVKELILICDYYGFSKEIKANKLGKDLLIQCLVDYELDPVNAVNVEKRRNMWFFINELKNDKFMKKFVLW
jgi:hypothetical protein